MKTVMTLSILALLHWASVQAYEGDKPSTETTTGWVKHPKNPVLGGDLGTCFDMPARSRKALGPKSIENGAERPTKEFYRSCAMTLFPALLHGSSTDSTNAD